MDRAHTAGILIIGNEILSGKVRDSNAYFLTCELRALGVEVKRISVIPDETAVIGTEARIFSELYDFVFTSGGVGPTHDDVTMEGIAQGFGRALRRHERIISVLQSRYGTSLNAAQVKMAEIPEGAEVMLRENMRFPVVKFRNIYIFPGIPAYIRNKFHAIREEFRSPAFHLKKIYLNGHESEIAGTLNSIVARNRDVSFGSYPVLDMPDYRIIITAESRSESALQTAVAALLGQLPRDLIVRIE